MVNGVPLRIGLISQSKHGVEDRAVPVRRSIAIRAPVEGHVGGEAEDLPVGHRPTHGHRPATARHQVGDQPLAVVATGLPE